MQEMQNPATNFTIDISMTKAQISTKIETAAAHVNQQNYSVLKQRVLNDCFHYARANLASVFAKDPSRYAIYSNIVNFAGTLDDLHFFAFVEQEFKSLAPNTHSRNFRDVILPYTSRNLNIMLAPSILKSQKAFLGLAAGGMMLFATRADMRGSMLVMVGILGYLGAENLIRARLDRSLTLKLHQHIAQGVDTTVQITDGFQDEFAIFERQASSMLSHGVSFFSRTGGQLRWLTQFSFGRRNQPLPSAPPQQRDQQSDNAPRVEILK